MLRERFFPCVLLPAAWVCFKISAKRIVACVWTHLPRAATVLPPMSSGFVGSDELSISPLKKMPLKKRRTTGEVGVANREKCETATLAATCQVIGEVWGLPLAPQSLHTCLQDCSGHRAPNLCIAVVKLHVNGTLRPYTSGNSRLGHCLRLLWVFFSLFSWLHACTCDTLLGLSKSRQQSKLYLSSLSDRMKYSELFLRKRHRKMFYYSKAPLGEKKTKKKPGFDQKQITWVFTLRSCLRCSYQGPQNWMKSLCRCIGNVETISFDRLARGESPERAF